MQSTTWSGPRRRELAAAGLTVLFALALVFAVAAPARADSLDQTMLTFSATPTVVNWAQPWALNGKLMESDMDAIPDAPVDLQASIDGGASYATLEGVMPAAGTSTYSGNYAAPYENTIYRLFYAGDATHDPAWSDPVTVTPRVKLGTPVAPSSLKKGAKFTAYGSLTPQQPKSSKTVKIKCYLKQSGKWVLKKTVSATNANRGSATRYSAKFSLWTRGSWKLVGYSAATDKYATTTSGNETLKVK